MSFGSGRQVSNPESSCRALPRPSARHRISVVCRPPARPTEGVRPTRASPQRRPAPIPSQASAAVAPYRQGHWNTHLQGSVPKRAWGEAPDTTRFPCKYGKADARIRTADPFITRVDRGGQPVPYSPSRPCRKAKSPDSGGQWGAQRNVAVFGWCSARSVRPLTRIRLVRTQYRPSRSPAQGLFCCFSEQQSVMTSLAIVFGLASRTRPTRRAKPGLASLPLR
jgi:hypothetical protein